MLFKVLSKDSFRQLVDLLLDANEVIAPRVVSERSDGTPIHQFLPIERFDEMSLDYVKTEYSAKTYFLPFQETLSTYDFEGSDWKQKIRYRIQPRAIIGLHACDVNALVKLDKVLLKGDFPSPYYLARRENTFIIGIDHDPCDNGFCASVGADIVSHGFDLFLTDLGDRYFVAIDSDRGFRVASTVDLRDVTDEDREEYMKVRNRIAAAFKTEVNIRNLPTVLDLEFESPVWQRWGEKCLSCGSCAAVCPTCYCYGTEERVSMDFSKSEKKKRLYSCNLYDFAMVAGDHNFRPTRASRLKYRYYHQHRGFTETYDEPKCVGCNRCGDTCLAGISPPEVIADLEKEALR
ncbi:MAG: 4Fe-4S dicluster domain-containing protein [Deltaproteobacteria bacterium]|jgi:formate hydrogenlyase subunit 6/NADH:ubiquinone oxidoreductase subunit I|nr:4Fe-4S dicluster domain-containing protein [Deltaproteobacteria bacterium]MBW2532772.1 4Fe-4S dicluster domain-containing protein [Deltaproteobacteria bacterium]